MQSLESDNANSDSSGGWFRRALPTLAMLLAVALFVVAGNWQRSRMHQKERFGEQLAAAAASAPVPLPNGVADWTPWRFRVVDVEGRFDAAHQMLIDNKVHDGRIGYHVVAPLVIADGRVILVNRGFAPGGSTRADLPSVPPPAGEVRVRGRLSLPSPDYFELQENAPVGNVWQNLDPGRFAVATGVDVLPVVIEQRDGPGDGLVRDWPRPDAGTDKHRIYMVQWYAFAVLAAGLWGWFTFGRSRR